MRIAVITSSYPRFKGDGIAPFVKSISESLAKRGHKVRVLAPYDVDVQETHDSDVVVTRFKYIWPRPLHIMGHARSLKEDVKLRPIIPLLMPSFLLASIIYLIKICREMNAQVIHAHWVLPNGFAAGVVSKLLKIPLIISLHGSDIFLADKNFIFRFFAKWAFSQSSSVTACSQELYDRAKKINKDIEIHLLPWGANPEKFKPLENRDAVREKYGWDADEIIISTLGRMVHKKGFSKLIEIVPNLISNEKKIKVVIGGSGPIEDSLKNKVRTMNLDSIVMFPGQISWDDVPEFLAASDIFVLPSQRDKAGNLDGLPTVLLEAMSCGVPCVASDVGGVSLVITSSENGIIVPPTSYEKLTDSLTKIICDGNFRLRISQEARKSIVREFNWENVSTKFEELFTYALIKYRLPSET